MGREAAGAPGDRASGLVGIELVLLDLELRRPVRAADQVHDARPVLFARVVTADAEGWGECAALAEGTSVDPRLAEVRQAAVVSVVPEFVARATGVDPHHAGEGTEGGRFPLEAALPAARHPATRMARAMVEMAVLDAALRAAGMSLGAHLGAPAGSVPVGAVVGIPRGRDPGALMATVEAALDPAGGGARRIRLKIAPGWDVVPVAVVRERHPSLALQADANGSYRLAGGGPGGVGALEALRGYALDCIEQPLPPAQVAESARLAATLGIPLCLDESLTDADQVAAALAARAMAVACLKPGRLGGIRAALEAAARCAARGVGVFIGGFFETGLGRSANLAVAASAGCTLASDLTAPSGYLNQLPFAYPAVEGGLVPVPDRPGVSGGPNEGVLAQHASWRRWFPAAR